MNRAQRRERQRAIKKAGKKGTDMERKLGLFDMMPDECSACVKEFNKRDKEMVSTWNVVVREKEGVVRLFCPDCWKMAGDMLKQFGEEIDEKNTGL